MMKRTLLALSILLALVPTAALAVSFEDPSASLGLGTADLKNTAINIINWVLGLLGIIAVVMIIYAGFVLLTAGGGNEERALGARKIISAAVIGLIIILLAWAIVNFVLKSTGNVSGAA